MWNVYINQIVNINMNIRNLLKRVIKIYVDIIYEFEFFLMIFLGLLKIDKILL